MDKSGFIRAMTQHTMKALVKDRSAAGLSLVDRPVPKPASDEILIQVRKAAICGTDLHIYEWDHWASQTIPVPMTIGHEFVGEVAAIGASVKRFKVGERVSGEGHLTCGACENCRSEQHHLCPNVKGVGIQHPGAFAQYLVLPESNVISLPETISDEIAAILDPLGNAVHAALYFNITGEDVLITGAGPIGLMALRIAKHVGARHVVVVDTNSHRLNLARSLGASAVIDPKKDDVDQIKSQLGMSHDFFVGLEMSGSEEGLLMLIEHLYPGGSIALLGIPPDKVVIDVNQLIFKGLNLKGIYGRKMFHTWYQMLRLLESGLDVSPVITDTFDASEYQQAFETLQQGKAGKVVLDWQSFS